MKLLISYIFLVAFFLFTSCKKEVSNAGIGALGINDPVLEGVDTFSVQTSTRKYDSLVSSNPAYLLLGSSIDPVFGKVNASFYSQVRLTSIKPNFGALADLKVDSVVVGIRYSDYYGKLTPQVFEVYKLSEALNATKTYYTNSSVEVDNENLIENPGTILNSKSLNYYFVDGSKDTVRDQFRIRLKTKVGEDLITEAINNASTYASVDAFNTWFKGLNIRSSNTNQVSGDGAVFTIALAPKLIIYYTLAGVPKKYIYELNANGVRFNSYSFDKAGSTVESAMKDQNTKEFYAQSNTIRSFIKFPTVTSISKTSIVHNAQLVLSYVGTDVNPYYVSSEVSVAIPTSSSDPSLRILGYASVDTLNKRYVIDLTEHIQSLVTMKRLNLGIVIAPKFFSTSAERIRFHDEFSEKEKKPKLYIKYSSY